MTLRIATSAFIVLVFCMALGSPDAEAAVVRRGPWLQQVTGEHAIVVWETQDEATVHVRYGTTPAMEERSADSGGLHHEVRLDGLGVGTTIYYALYEEDEALTETCSFTSATGPETAFRFVVFGDNRSDAVAHGAVVNGILAEPGLAFVINSGDMVGSGEVESDWETFFDIEGELLAHMPDWPTIGNHEAHDGEVPIYDRLFALPTEGTGTEHYYAFTFGNSRFLVLDGHVEVEPWYQCLLQLKAYDECFTRAQDAFIADELERAVADPAIRHIFVTTHMGPYSSKEGRTGSSQMRAWLPRFLQYGVDVVFSGHDHYYEHGVSGNGIDYVISGGGGAPLYDVNPGIGN